MEGGTLKVFELLLVVGGVLAFGVWQLRSVDRDRRQRLLREAQAEADARASQPVEHTCDGLPEPVPDPAPAPTLAPTPSPAQQAASGLPPPGEPGIAQRAQDSD